MKRKVLGQIHSNPAESLKIAPALQERVLREQVQQEIEKFLHALDSYPASVAKNPRLTFRQHLCGIVMIHDLRPAVRPDLRPDARSRRQ